jgi:hypothetical protein
MYLIKYINEQIQYFYMFRHRDAMPSSGSYSQQSSIRPTYNLGTVSAFLKWLKY